MAYFNSMLEEPDDLVRPGDVPAGEFGKRQAASAYVYAKQNDPSWNNPPRVAMPIEDTTDYEAGGPMAKPFRRENAMATSPNPAMRLAGADLNGNGIPDGAEIMLKRQLPDGSSLTAKWKHEMKMFDDSQPQFQAAPLPPRPGQTFAADGSMAPYNRLSPLAQARIMGNRTMEDQNRFVTGQTNTFNAAVANDRDRKLAFDIQRSMARTKMAGGLMQLAGHEADAQAEQTAALMRFLGVQDTAAAKLGASDNYLRGREYAADRALEGTQSTANARVDAADIRGRTAQNVAEIQNQGRAAVADANNTAAANRPLKMATTGEQFVQRGADGKLYVLSPISNAVPVVASAENKAVPRNRDEVLSMYRAGKLDRKSAENYLTQFE